MAQTQGTLLEVLKKKMRAMKDELEAAKEIADETQIRLQEEIRRREEVSPLWHQLLKPREQPFLWLNAITRSRYSFT